jgi:hypothetical protein
MVAVYSSETYERLCQSTCRHIPDQSSLQSQRSKKPISQHWLQNLYLKPSGQLSRVSNWCHAVWRGPLYVTEGLNEKFHLFYYARRGSYTNNIKTRYRVILFKRYPNVRMLEAVLAFLIRSMVICQTITLYRVTCLQCVLLQTVFWKCAPACCIYNRAWQCTSVDNARSDKGEKSWVMLDVAAYIPVATQWICKHPPFLGNSSVNTLTLLGSKFVIMPQLNHNNGNCFYVICVKKGQRSA